MGRQDKVTRLWGRLLAGAGVVMIPWMVVLSGELPGTVQAQHWSVAWLGLDVAIAVDLLATGLLLSKGDERFRLFAVSAATLFVLDGWFDILTAAAGRQRLLSVTLAVLFELPSAALCLWLALRARRSAAPAGTGTAAVLCAQAAHDARISPDS